MSFSDAISTLRKIRLALALVSILTGAGGYKYGPTVWHKAQTEFHAKTQARTEVKTEDRANAKIEASSKTTSPPNPILEGTATNADETKVSSCDLGALSLTNHYETCVSLGKDRDCLLEPSLIDKRNVQLTLTVQTKNAKGKVQGLSVTQVVARLGKPLEVAVGGFSFSFTPNMAADSSE